VLTNVLLPGAFTVPCVQKTHAHVQDHAPGVFGIRDSLNHNLFPARRKEGL